MKWNSLYLSDDEVGPLEEAAREAEWMDDMRRAEYDIMNEKED